jgi:hypothetical protein
LKISSTTAVVCFAGFRLSAGLPLEHLKTLNPVQFGRPVISNGEWETFRVVDSEAACHLVFRDGLLWQVRIALFVDGDRQGFASESLERERHAAHEAFLLREIGATDLRFPDGSRIELCFDVRNLGSSIVVTYAKRDASVI